MYEDSVYIIKYYKPGYLWSPSLGQVITYKPAQEGVIPERVVIRVDRFIYGENMLCKLREILRSCSKYGY